MLGVTLRWINTLSSKEYKYSWLLCATPETGDTCKHCLNWFAYRLMTYCVTGDALAFNKQLNCSDTVQLKIIFGQE